MKNIIISFAMLIASITNGQIVSDFQFVKQNNNVYSIDNFVKFTITKNNIIMDEKISSTKYKIIDSMVKNNKQYYYALDKKATLFLFIVSKDNIEKVNNNILVRYFRNKKEENQKILLTQNK